MGLPRRRQCTITTVLVVLCASSSFFAPTTNAENEKGSPLSTAAAAAAAASTSHSSETSACANKCFEKAKQLGFDRVAGDSLSCFLGYQGRMLGTYDCCDKAELLLGRKGDMAECWCCPEFAQAMLTALPFDKLGTTPQQFLEKLHLCRVPIMGQKTCSNSGGASSSTAGATRQLKQSSANGVADSSGSSSSGNSNTTSLKPINLLDSFNLTGLYPWVGFDSRFDAGVLAAQGRAAVASGEAQQIQVIGASPIYNDYITGFVMWIERETPRYSSPKTPELPPLPDQYKDDVQWVAALRRGPYPDLVKNRPEQYSPARTDPLQNGEISNLPPGPAFAGKLQLYAPPPTSSP